MSEKNNFLFLALRFVRTNILLIFVISALLIVPCFWHRHIEAGDLPSHTFNAWLATLIQQGRAPGVYLAPQAYNILFDLLLLYSVKLFGFAAGPQIVVAILVLIFFWGVFSFIAAISERPPWLLTPCIAMLAYGYTFNMGFFNYYLSMGLACFGLAILWKQPQRSDWLAAIVIFALATLAHPIGPLWFAGLLTYIAIRKKIRWPWRLIIPAAIIASFAAFHWYVENWSDFEFSWPENPFYMFNGLDQLVLYSARYRFVAYALLAIFIFWLVSEYVQRRESPISLTPFFLSLELYLVAFCIISLLPQNLRGGPNSVWIGLLVSRLTVIAAIFALCILSALRPSKPAALATLACSIFFFTLLYRDTATLNRLESHAESLTAQLPFGTLVIPTLASPRDSRIPFVHHIVDRACIGHCFTYSNYEPSSFQFHVRVSPGSPLIAFRADDAQEMEAGNYIVRVSDPPFVDIYQCSPTDFTVLCARTLTPGEKTGPPNN
ncbi:MAG: hypothetical protein QOG55_1844 [Acidobacteriaceae bacterium]|jgi:hypothetical protein|nr:hypothetical protein [Acidobacteriaceae bacterium]